MKWSEWFENWSMTKIKVKAPFLDMEWNPQDKDKDAAWELYIELLTRVTTQPLAVNDGDEADALKSLHEVFKLTRGVIKHYGRGCMEFTKLAIPVLNQILRPFTARWHKKSLAGEFIDSKTCEIFRTELLQIQDWLLVYTKMLGDMAGIEDDNGLTQLEGE